MWRGSPAISRVSSAKARQRGESSRRSASGSSASSSATLLRVPAVGDAREPLQLGEREPERLADVADRAARAVGGEAGDERGVLAPVALGDAEDQLLADVAREVEVDVRHRHQLAVEEAAEREVLRDRVDVREAGQVADDRPHRRAPAPAGRQPAPRRARPADPVRELPRQLEHLPVEEEEAGEAELVDQPELRSRAARGPGQVTVCCLAGSGSANASSQTSASCVIAGTSPSEKSG